MLRNGMSSILHRLPWTARPSRSLAMWTKYFWLSLAERAVKSFAQGLIVVWPIGENALGLWQINWQTALLSAALYAGASMLTSIISAPLGPDGSPSLVGEPPKEPFAEPPAGVWVHQSDELDQATIADAKVHDHALDGDPDEVPARHYMTEQEVDDLQRRKP
jgi:hypothetical protein